METQIDRKEFYELLKAYKTTNMSGYEFIDKLQALGCSLQTASMIHEAATINF